MGSGALCRSSALIEATGVTQYNIRGKFIGGLIGLEYSLDDQIALLANGEDSEQHFEELAAFNRVRTDAKKAVDELLQRLQRATYRIESYYRLVNFRIALKILSVCTTEIGRMRGYMILTLSISSNLSKG